MCVEKAKELIDKKDLQSVNIKLPLTLVLQTLKQELELK
jgi:hypothetical protein